MNDNKITIGIIGYGRFGVVLESLFHKTNLVDQVQIYSRSKKTGHNQKFSDLQTVLKSDLIFLAIPISQIKPWFIKHASLLSKTVTSYESSTKQKQMWVSVCSVMEEPKAWFDKYLPKTVDLLVSHPLFGPMSTKQGTHFKELPWVIDVQASCTENHSYQSLLLILREIGIKPIFLSAKEHDQKMARSQAIAFLFGRIGHELSLEKTGLDTPGFQHVLANQKMFEGDSPQLFFDMFNYNTYAKKILKQTQKILKIQLESFDED